MYNSHLEVKLSRHKFQVPNHINKYYLKRRTSENIGITFYLQNFRKFLMYYILHRMQMPKMENEVLRYVLPTYYLLRVTKKKL